MRVAWANSLPVRRNREARNAAPVIGSYVCDAPTCSVFGDHGDHCWHESARRRLAWQYGEARANRIALGIDKATQRDLTAWNRLGSQKRAA